MASRPGAQGRLRPEHRKRRGSSAVPARGTATGSNEAGIRTRGRRLARDAPAETCLRRRNVRLPGIICRRLQITADMRGDPTSRVAPILLPGRTFCRLPGWGRWSVNDLVDSVRLVSSADNTPGLAGWTVARRASRSRWMPCWRVMTGWYRSSRRARASEMRKGRRFSSTIILVRGGSPGRLVMRQPTSRVRASPAAAGPGMVASGRGRPCA